MYTLSDLGDWSNPIGSLSRTIQNIRLLASGQCVSSVFFLFFREWSFKNRQYPRVDIFKVRKDFEGFKTAFFHLPWLSFVPDGLFTTPVYSSRRGRFVNSARVSEQEKFGPKSKFIYNEQIGKQMFTEILRFK